MVKNTGISQKRKKKEQEKSNLIEDGLIWANFFYVTAKNGAWLLLVKGYLGLSLCYYGYL